MKIICLIDSLNSGGAQRQMCYLATNLKKCGFDIELVVYHELNFYKQILDDASINIQVAHGSGKISRILAVRKLLRNSNADLVISFLKSSNIMAALACMPNKKFKLIVSERNTEPNGLTRNCKIRFFFYKCSDFIVN